LPRGGPFGRPRRATARSGGRETAKSLIKNRITRWSVSLGLTVATGVVAARGASGGGGIPAVVSPRLARADDVVRRGVAAGIFPGGVLVVGRHDGPMHLRRFGQLSTHATDGSVELDTLYDLASLTKVVATTSVAMVLADRGQLALDSRLSAWFPEMAGPIREKARVRDLLAHSAGLPAWRALSRETRDKRGVVQRILQTDLEYEPGTRSVYTDLGMILLGEIIERVAGEGLDAAAQRLVFGPLGMTDTAFRPDAERRGRTAPTIDDPWRGRLLRGEVQDENAYRMGGVAGHAGLFGTARNLSRLAETMLGGGEHGGARWVNRSTVALFTQRVDVPGSTRTLGWETPAGDAWAGHLWSDRAYGHTGQTGTSIWIDPARDLYVVLLTNRLQPAAGDDFDTIRRDLADAVLAAMPARRTEP